MRYKLCRLTIKTRKEQNSSGEVISWNSSSGVKDLRPSCVKESVLVMNNLSTSINNLIQVIRLVHTQKCSANCFDARIHLNLSRTDFAQEHKVLKGWTHKINVRKFSGTPSRDVFCVIWNCFRLWLQFYLECLQLVFSLGVFGEDKI